MVMLAMTILVHFGVLYLYWVSERIYTHTRIQPAALHCTLQPRHLAHTRPANSPVWTVHDAFYVT
jgi:hypothetical protein